MGECVHNVNELHETSSRKKNPCSTMRWQSCNILAESLAIRCTWMTIDGT